MTQAGQVSSIWVIRSRCIQGRAREARSGNVIVTLNVRYLVVDEWISTCSPDSDGVIARAGDNTGAVGRVCHRVDCVDVSLEWTGNKRAIACTLDSNSAISGARGDVCAVR